MKSVRYKIIFFIFLLTMLPALPGSTFFSQSGFSEKIAAYESVLPVKTHTLQKEDLSIPFRDIEVIYHFSRNLIRDTGLFQSRRSGQQRSSSRWKEPEFPCSNECFNVSIWILPQTLLRLQRRFYESSKYLCLLPVRAGPVVPEIF